MRQTDNASCEIGRQPEMPHDTDTERSVLATFVRHNETYLQVSDMLSAELFYNPKEKAIYKTIAGTLDDGQVADTNSLTAWARTHDTGAQLERFDFIEISQHASKPALTQDIARLIDMARRRQCWTILQQAAANAVNMAMPLTESVDAAIRALTDLLQANGSNGTVPVKEAVDELRDIVDEHRKPDGKAAAVEAGYHLFDSMSLLRPGTLTVIAAFTSVGKTALAMSIATNAARAGNPVAYYSLEMGKAELAARVIAEDAQTPASIIMNKELSSAQYADFKFAASKNEGLPIYIDERSTISFDRTVRSIRRMAKTKDIRLAVIDYLQIYSQTGDNVEASLAQMARQAKNIAKEVGIAVILLSQLNRSAPKPAINMLRGSGQIEESADNIVLIDRPDAYNTKTEAYKLQEAKLILAKGRGVGTADETVTFLPIYTKFESKYYPSDNKPF